MILIAGDSFTALTKNPMWHDHLINPKHERLNLAVHGAGNLYIGESVKRLLTSKVRACLLMWSDMDRLDVPNKKKKSSLATPYGGKIWNHYGRITSRKGKADWKRLGYDKVVEMNIESITSTHQALDNKDIPYAYSFITNNDLIPQHLKAKAIQPFLGNFAQEQGMLQEDNYHANVDAHLQWSNMIRPQITFMDVIS
tara:strand:- start:74 stop:664 length:591 start_codon:yes stop_codon:yes gene_type:complete